MAVIPCNSQIVNKSISILFTIWFMVGKGTALLPKRFTGLKKLWLEASLSSILRRVLTIFTLGSITTTFIFTYCQRKKETIYSARWKGSVLSMPSLISVVRVEIKYQLKFGYLLWIQVTNQIYRILRYDELVENYFGSDSNTWGESRMEAKICLCQL